MTQKTKNKPIRRLLIANRGEIAVRIIRAARDLGIQTIAVYSDADQFSMHVKQADFSVRLPGNTSAETYLNVPGLIEAIKTSKADAVHPGYGFLSESAEFAEAVAAVGAKFVGPSPEAMRKMGDKIHAKRLMKEHNVPCTPGSENPIKDVDDLKQIAKTVGYPIILKASAGGGGRGMRVVRTESDLAEAFAACTREAQSYFGNPDVFCERYVENPRHIEVQVLFDEHGNGVHLFERDCSVQRRHQKLIEEAPSMFLSNEQRMEVGRRAVVAAKAAGYSSAGTIEFICESKDRIYFMEMNTRIQVEHTVSEEITGIDLVSWQLRVAQGEALAFKQEDIQLGGWAFEARINAEDPAKGFLPGPGKVNYVHFPAGPGVRVDTHLYPSYEIPPFYDSMVAKLIVWGSTREEAMNRLRRALLEFEIDGIPTTIKFHEAVLKHPDFVAGNFNTGFIEKEAAYFKKYFATTNKDSIEDAAVLAAVENRLLLKVTASESANNDTATTRSRWVDSSRNL